MASETVSEQLVELSSTAEVDAFVESRPELRDPAIVRDLTDEVLVYLRRDWDQAQRLADAAIQIADRLEDPYSRGLAARAQGHILYLRSQCEAALDRYADAARHFHSVNDPRERAITLSSSLQALILLGRYDDAFKAAEEARAILGHREPLLLARLECNIGNILHRLDRSFEALEHYQRALRFFDQQGGSPQDISAALLNSAVCQIAVNRYDDAAESYEALSALCDLHDMPTVKAQADYNIAYLYYRRGEYTRAIELYGAAESLCKQVGDPQHEALCHLDLAELYLEVNLSNEGRQHAEEAFNSFEILGLKHEVAKSLAFMAIAAYQEANAFKALKLFDESRQRFVAEGNRPWVAMVDFYRALILLEEGRPIEAWRLASASLPVFVEIQSPTKAAVCELLLARIELARRKPREALLRCNTTCSQIDQHGLTAISYQAHLIRGQIFEQLGDPDQAVQDYERSFGMLESLRSQLQGDELKISFIRDKQVVYQSLVWLTLPLGATPEYQAKAFDYAEHAKSRVLADLFAFPRRVPLTGTRASDDLVREMQRLREELNWYYREIDLRELGGLTRPKPLVAGSAGDSTEPKRAGGLGQETRKAEGRLIEILSELRTDDPNVASMQPGGAKDLTAIRAALPPNTRLLQWYESRQTLFAFVVGHETLHAVPVTTPSNARRIQRLLQFQFSRFKLDSESAAPLGRTSEGETLAHLHELYQELIAPIRHLLDGERLVVVPHGSLHYIPFHALYSGSRFLIDDFTISYAPSASVFELCANTSASNNESAIVVGLADPAMPHLETEARAVSDCLSPSRLFIGHEPAEQILAAVAGGCRILHISTRAHFRRDNAMFSTVQLGGDQRTLFDLYQLKIPADLVVLSGSSTGLGSTENGDEVIGLTRGLLYAGAQSVISTLWDTRDRSTTELMIHLYRHLSEHGDRALALREAMIDQRQVSPHPFHWAPFILSGKALADRGL